jgi:hypothetical protein
MSLLKRASVVLASIVFSLVASAASAAMTCDVNGDGVIDRNDINVIMAARGQPASGPGDVRDAVTRRDREA